MSSLQDQLESFLVNDSHFSQGEKFLKETAISFLQLIHLFLNWLNYMQILDDLFASEMQKLLGKSLQDKDLDPPRSVIEARSILCWKPVSSSSSISYFLCSQLYNNNSFMYSFVDRQFSCIIEFISLFLTQLNILFKTRLM